MEWVLPTTSTPAAENKDRLYIYLENVRCYTDGSLVAPGGEREYVLRSCAGCILGV